MAKADSLMSLNTANRRESLFNRVSALRKEYSDLTDHEVIHVIRLYAHTIDSRRLYVKKERR